MSAHAVCLLYLCNFRLLSEGICHEKNIPSISSINRIIRDKAILQRRSLDSLSCISACDQNSISGVSMCDSSDQEEVSMLSIKKIHLTIASVLKIHLELHQV